MASTHSLLIIERILRDRDGVWEQIGDERDLGRLIRDLLFSSTVGLFCFGAVLGAFNTDNAFLQALLSALKLPLLFLVTLAICLPTLYLFNLVFGARLQVRQALALVMVAITVISMLAVAFAPISLFFLVTANQYSFYKLLNVAILTLSAVVGLRFLTGGMAALNKHNAVRDAAARAAVEAESAAQARAAAAVGAVGARPALEASTGDGAAAAPSTDAVPVSPAPAGAEPPVPAPAGAEPPVPVPPVPVPPPVQPTPPVPVPVAAGAPHGNGAGVLVAPHPQAHFTGMRVGAPAPVPVPWSPHPQPPPAEKQASMTLLYVWILLFGFVGTQLAWTLRPFFGSPGEDFELFRSIDGNFYVDIVRTFGQLF